MSQGNVKRRISFHALKSVGCSYKNKIKSAQYITWKDEWTRGQYRSRSKNKIQVEQRWMSTCSFLMWSGHGSGTWWVNVWMWSVKENLVSNENLKRRISFHSGDSAWIVVDPKAKKRAATWNWGLLYLIIRPMGGHQLPMPIPHEHVYVSWVCLIEKMSVGTWAVHLVHKNEIQAEHEKMSGLVVSKRY